MTIKSTILCCTALAFILCPLASEDKPASTKKISQAHKIIDRMVEALGGEKAIKKIKTRVTSGEMTMTAQGITLKMHVSQKAPNKVTVTQEIPGIMTAKQGFDGEKGWAQDPLQGSRQIEGDELEQLKRESNITREITLKQEYPTMEVLPEETKGDQTFQVIKATSADNRIETWHFDKKTGLLAKLQQKMSFGASGELDVTLVPTDYREVDGIKIPFVTEMKSAAIQGVMTFAKVKHNVELDDKMFAEPVEEDEE